MTLNTFFGKLIISFTLLHIIKYSSKVHFFDLLYKKKILSFLYEKKVFSFQTRLDFLPHNLAMMTDIDM